MKCWLHVTSVTRFTFSHSNASEAKRFCLEHECPANWNNANEDNCCAYHANIHSCPLALMVSAVMVGVKPTESALGFCHTAAEIFKIKTRLNMVHFVMTSEYEVYQLSLS